VGIGITNEDIVRFFSDRSIYSKLNILVNYNVYIVDNRIKFSIERKALNDFENYTTDEYKYEKYKIENSDYQTEKIEENIEEIKWMNETELKEAFYNTYPSIRDVFRHYNLMD